MEKAGYQIRNQAAPYFITFAVVEWVDVFARKIYRDIVLESLKYCKERKGLLLHAWCIMSNHLHLIVSARNEDLSGVLRDFKKFTSKRIINAIMENEGERRKQWMLRVFNEAGRKNSRNTNYQFWQQNNRPQELYSPAFIFQKLNYTHMNPVKAFIVERPEQYLYSSAKDYFFTRKCGLLDLVFCKCSPLGLVLRCKRSITTLKLKMMTGENLNANNGGFIKTIKSSPQLFFAM